MVVGLRYEEQCGESFYDNSRAEKLRSQGII